MLIVPKYFYEVLVITTASSYYLCSVMRKGIHLCAERRTQYKSYYIRDLAIENVELL